MPRPLTSSLLALALASALAAGVACRGPADSSLGGLTTLETTASSAGSAEGTATPTGTASATSAPEDATSAADPTDPATIVPLGEAEAKQLESELKAIERELEKLDLPSDKDFEGIESELP